MAEELVSSRPVREGDRGTFPAGTAVLALAVCFVVTRLLSRLASEHRVLATIAEVAGITGSILAALTLLVNLIEGVRIQSGGRRVLASLQLLAGAQVTMLVAASLRGVPSPTVQWCGVAGAAALIVMLLVDAVARATGEWLVRGSLVLLLVGELVELGWPPTHFAFETGEGAAQWFSRLGGVSELATLLGAALALAWSVRATLRAAGPMRTRMFLPLPVFIAVLLSMMATSFPPRAAVAVAEVAFGARFDLLWRSESAHLLPTSALLLYLLMPELLLCAASVSLAAVGFDRGAAARRSLGWTAVLMAGFGALRMAGPMDPVRIVTVSLGVLLLSQSVGREDAPDAAA